MERDPARLDGIETTFTHLGPVLEAFATETRHEPVPAFEAPLEPLPSQGIGLDATMHELADLVADGCRIGMPGWFGFVTTAPTTAPAAAAAAVSVAGGQRYLFHSFNHLEHLALRWLAELCGIPASAAGVFTSGGSTANLVALGAARQDAFERRGHDVSDDGMPSASTRIYSSERAHRTVHRSAAVLGLGRRVVRDVEADIAGHLDASALDRALGEDISDGVVPIAVVAVAGTTDTGSVDRLDDIADVCDRHGVWLHVDGAYGLVARAGPDTSGLFDGVERADSWIVDPHKWLASGTGTGAAFVRDGALLTRAFAEGHAAYLEGSFAPAEERPVSQFDGFSGGWADQAVELSAPPRGATVWAVLREIGRDGVAERVRRHVGFARLLAEQVRDHPELELLCEPDLSIVCYRYVPRSGAEPQDVDRLNSEILRLLRQETATVPTSTVVDGRFAIRPCFINPRTTVDEVHSLLDSTVRLGRRLGG